MKTCTKCKIPKELEEFPPRKVSKDGKHTHCRSCINKYSKSYKEANKEYTKANDKRYRDSNKNKVKLSQKEYTDKYRENNGISYNSKYYKENVDKHKQYHKDYFSKNKVHVLKRMSNWVKSKKQSDPLFRLKLSTRSFIKSSFNRGNANKNDRTETIIGCTIEEFKIYLESKFESWMSWDNYGIYNHTFSYGWDLDHIIPLCTAKSEEDIIKLNHYTNIQPLCSHINRDIKRGRTDY